MILSYADMVEKMCNHPRSPLTVTGVRVRLDDWFDTWNDSLQGGVGEDSTPLLFCGYPIVIDNDLAPGEFEFDREG